MPIVHKFLADGAFVAGDTETRLTCYAYPASSFAMRARKRLHDMAEAMLETEHPSDHRAEYDNLNWTRLSTEEKSSDEP